MGRKRASRQSKTIGLKAFCDADADILDWWESLPEGERSDTLRDLIRAAITGQRIKANGHRAKGQLAQLSEDTAWIRNTLSELPAYLEHLLGQIAVGQSVSQDEVSAVQQEEGPRLEQEAMERRRAKMRQNAW